MDVHEPESQQLKTEVEQALAQNQSIRITTTEEYQHAQNAFLVLKALGNKIDQHYDPLIRQADQLHKALIKARTEMRGPVELTWTRVWKAIQTWETEQERLRQEQQQHADEHAQRLHDDMILHQAEALEAEGRTDEADTLLEIAAVLPVVPRQNNRVAGFSTRPKWKAVVVNPELVPDAYWVIDEQKLNAVVRAAKGKITIPGVRVEQDTTPVGRTP